MAFGTTIQLQLRFQNCHIPRSVRRPRASVALPPRPNPPKTPPSPSSPPPQPVHIVSETELSILTSSNRLVVLKTYSKKCRSCRKIERPFARLAEELSGHVVCVQLCAEQAQQMAQSLGIRGFPTFVIWKDGRRVDHFTGNSMETIREEIESWL